ncbi:hypothetical protein LBMAG42_32940 [Deltaproteobacteria bacterium]|nr:hypothetical protein LBMAG42_32940 [Deltaproteobacteria bacterium]
MLFLFSHAFAAPAFDLLKLRDPVPCAALGEATPVLRDELLLLTAPDILPSSVPMRAADCLAERFAEDPAVQAAFTAWTLDPARPGQVLLLLGRADTLPEPMALALVRGSLASPSARVSEKARSVAELSAAASIRALVTP